MENVKIGKNEHTDCLLFLQLVTARSKTSSFVIGSLYWQYWFAFASRLHVDLLRAVRAGSKIDAPF